MTVRELIQKGGLHSSAAATPATFATDDGTVATVATVAVATPDQRPTLSPELERLVVLAAKHYRVPPGEVELMKQEAAKEPNQALICFRDIAEKQGLL